MLQSLRNYRERTPRHSVNMVAWIRSQNSSFAPQPCRVLDVSRTGVRLEAANAYSIPENFILSFSKNDTGHSATVKWRQGTQIGAEFSKT